MGSRAQRADTTLLRLADRSDAEALARLHYLSHTVSFRSFADPDWVDRRDWPSYMAFWASYLTDRSIRDRTWIALSDGRATGTVTIMDLTFCSDAFRPLGHLGIPPGRIGCLRLMYVHPARRREGIGSRLMREARHYMADRGDVCATLVTHAVNGAARTFYEARGWALDAVFHEQVPEFFDEPPRMRCRARYRLRIRRADPWEADRVADRPPGNRPPSADYIRR